VVLLWRVDKEREKSHYVKEGLIVTARGRGAGGEGA